MHAGVEASRINSFADDMVNAGGACDVEALAGMTALFGYQRLAPYPSFDLPRNGETCMMKSRPRFA